jgi:hypothetical protein
LRQATKGYFLDSRLISSWNIFANGAPFELLNSGAITHHGARVYLTNPVIETEQGGIAEHTPARAGRAEGVGKGIIWGMPDNVLFVALILVCQCANCERVLRPSMNFSGEVAMDKKIAGLVGAVSALATMTGVEAARAQNVTEVLNARSYAELLQPIPNAVALLMAADAVNVARVNAEAAQDPNMKLAQYGYHHHHHHHRWYHHHHHHHHHHHYDGY